MELESNRLKEDLGYDFDQELPVLLRSKRTRYDQIYDHRMARNTCPIQVHEFSVTSMGGKNLFVSLTCDETTDAMSRICEVFESLKLKIITANIPTLSELVKKTVLIEDAGIHSKKMLFGVIVIMGSAKTSFVLLSALFLDRFGRRPLLLLGSAGMALALSFDFFQCYLFF